MSESIEETARKAIIRRFHEVYYDEAGIVRDGRTGTWTDTRFLGVPVMKCPLDLWVCQEIIHATRPCVVLETGTAHGGSALFLIHTLDMIQGNLGQVVTIDIEERPSRPKHDGIIYIKGSSIDPRVVAEAKECIDDEGRDRVMVVLDSDHSKAHVLAELDAYASLVTPGCYLVVEDTNVNGNPVARTHGPGPAEALAEWLPRHPEFVVDRRCEKLLVTFNPGGWLRRT